MYHRVAVDPGDRRYTEHPDDFAAQMRFLAERRYSVVSLDAVLDAADGATPLPPSPVAITFDDGFRETFEHARPVLKRFGYTATFFLVTGLTGQTNAWMQREGYRSAPLLDWAQASALIREGFAIGSHTVSHPRLDATDPTTAEWEIRDSKRALEDRLGISVRFFAYPYGRFNRRVRDLVEAAGYAAAGSTQSGFNGPTTDRFALRRLDVFGSTSLKAFERNLLFGENEMTSGRLLRYYATRFATRLVR